MVKQRHRIIYFISQWQSWGLNLSDVALKSLLHPPLLLLCLDIYLMHNNAHLHVPGPVPDAENTVQLTGSQHGLLPVSSYIRYHIICLFHYLTSREIMSENICTYIPIVRTM